MRGNLTILTGDREIQYELSKDRDTVGGGADCDLRLEGAGLDPHHASFEWSSESGGWRLVPASEKTARTLRVNGRQPSGPVLLQEGDRIELPEVLVRFHGSPAAPTCGGVPFEEWPLVHPGRWIMGRADDQNAVDSGKIVLDAEDPTISRQHAAVVHDAAEGYFIEDLSRSGTFLNGKRFDRRPLIIGDRFRIGAYHFEFTGRSLRLLPHHTGGRVEAAGLVVEVGNGKRILDGVNLDFPPCSFVGILGGSGQGKSTLLKALCGLGPAGQGEARINGVPVRGPADMRRLGIGYVPQDDIVHRELTVENAIRYGARLRLDSRIKTREIERLVTETLERLALSEHRSKRIRQLSGGQRKRVSIATELLTKPSVLFLDEPSSGLDPATEHSLMSLLRGLAGDDCTVVCTTHVLGRAYLFDRLCFIHQGRIAFDGTPDEALQTFDVEGLEEIYLKLEEQGLPEPAPAPPPLGTGPGEARPPPGRGARPRFFASLRVLLARQWKILCADRLNLVFLLAQPVLIAAMVAWVAEDVILRAFLCVVATLWFGCSNGAQQIVRELPVFRRERVCGQGMGAYLGSKYLFLTGTTTFQALLLFGLTAALGSWLHPIDREYDDLREKVAETLLPPGMEAGPSAEAIVFEAVSEDDHPADLPAPGPTEVVEPTQPLGAGWIAQGALRLGIAPNLLDSIRGAEADEDGRLGYFGVLELFAFTIGLRLLAMLGAAVVGVSIGLAISAVAQNDTQAVIAVPLILIPQILFGGFVVTTPEMSPSVRWTSLGMPSYSAQRMMDVGYIYGQETPRMSNRTRYPVFLTPTGERETVTWEILGEARSERYDKISDHNVAWQNLAVFPSLVGEHTHAFRMSRGRMIYDETTERRDDVRYPRGVLYTRLQPAWIGMIVLAAWVVACYLLALLFLSGKQRES